MNGRLAQRPRSGNAVDGLHQWVYMLVWVFVFTIPLKNAVILSDSLTITKLVGVGAMGAAVLTIFARQRVRKLRPFHYVFGVYVALTMGSYWWSIDGVATQRQISTFAQIVGMVWIIWEFARSRERQLGLLKAYVWGAYLAVFSTVFRYFTGTITVAARYGTAGFNPNDVGGLLVLGLPMAWYVATQEKRAYWRWFYQAYIVVALPAVLLTGSRSAFVAAFAGLLAVPLSYLRLSFARKVVASLITLLVIYGLVTYIPTETWQRLATVDSEVTSGSYGKRGPIWRAGLDVFPQYPILGVGAGGFNTAMVSYFQRSYAAHNVYLNILVELGLVGITVFVVMVGVVVWPVKEMKGAERAFWLVLLVTLALVLFPRNWEYRKPLWFILALLCAWSATTRKRLREQKRQRAAA